MQPLKNAQCEVFVGIFISYFTDTSLQNRSSPPRSVEGQDQAASRSPGEASGSSSNSSPNRYVRGLFCSFFTWIALTGFLEIALYKNRQKNITVHFR